jgi:hypothetical protein
MARDRLIGFQEKLPDLTNTEILEAASIGERAGLEATRCGTVVVRLYRELEELATLVVRVARAKAGGEDRCE